MDANQNNKFLIGLSHFYKFGPVKLKKLLKYFPNAELAYTSHKNELISAGIEEKLAHEFCVWRDHTTLDKALEILECEEIKTIALTSDQYPQKLREIFDPPFLLYYKGDLLAENDKFTIAVVGSRKFTNYGRQAAEKITRELAQNNIVVASGLALGIDTIAHQTALAAKGRTIAVLGTGIDRTSIYPANNALLAEKIWQNGGLLLSEFPPKTPPLKHHFPLRNRIVSGLSLGVLVIEASEKSGALITARAALDQNREVFAVPGNMFSAVSMGTNNLIKQGAKPITSAAEILESFSLNQIANIIENRKVLPKTPEEQQICAFLSHEPLHINDIVRNSKLDIAKINSILTIMEMKGLVKNVGAMQYVLKF